MRVPKGLCGFPVRKVATRELFQVPRRPHRAQWRYMAAANQIQSVPVSASQSWQMSQRATKPSVPQNQRAIAKLRQGVIVRGDNDQSPIVSGIRNE